MDAGLRMLPLLMLSAVGAGVGGAIVRYWNVSWYILASSFCLQMVGLGLMTTLPMTGEVAPAQFGYQAILGLGFGLTLSSEMAFPNWSTLQERRLLTLQRKAFSSLPESK